MSDDVDRVLRKYFYETVLTVVAPNKMQIGFVFVFLMAPAAEIERQKEVRRRRQVP